MRIFFSVGEPSGDLHGSNLIRRLSALDPTIECVGYGGPKMADAGCQIHFELTSLAVMFIGKVIGNLRLFFRLIDQADDYFRNHDVAAVVLIDYPGFNWWIARKAKKNGIPVFYYGVPQVWAWAPWRVRKIRKFVDHVLCKLPFEVDWFAQRSCHGTYVGHPYFDELSQKVYDDAFIAEVRQSGEQLLTLLPGSRDQEVENNLPVLLHAAQRIAGSVDGLKIAVACYNQRQQKMAATILKENWGAGFGHPRTVRSPGFSRSSAIQSDDAAANPSAVPCDVQLYVGRTPELMKSASACLACSGSVSMELLYHRKPTVIVYKIKRWVMFAQSFMLRTKYITLANLIATNDIKKRTWAPYDPDAANAEVAVMPEYMTTGDPSEAMAAHVIGWLTHPESMDRKIQQMNILAEQVAKPGATDKAADYIYKNCSAA